VLAGYLNGGGVRGYTAPAGSSASWTNTLSGGVETNFLWNIGSNGSRLVCLSYGSTSKGYYSDDGGANWTTFTSPLSGTGMRVRSIAWSGVIFLAGGEDTNTSEGLLAVSTDGLSWKLIEAAALGYVHTVIWAVGRFGSVNAFCFSGLGNGSNLSFGRTLTFSVV
jgi:hypothetical protein